MALPPLAEVIDFEQRLAREFDDNAERTQLEAWIEDASDLVRTVAGRDWVTADEPPVSNAPRVARLVTIRAVMRVLQNPDGLSSESAGDYSYQRNDVEDGGGIYLTAREEALLRRAVTRGNALWTQPVTRDERCADTRFVEDSFGCELFPLEAIPPY
jgi:Gp19/Gp15/Gp42-like protein